MHFIKFLFLVKLFIKHTYLDTPVYYILLFEMSIYCIHLQIHMVLLSHIYTHHYSYQHVFWFFYLSRRFLNKQNILPKHSICQLLEEQSIFLLRILLVEERIFISILWCIRWYNVFTSLEIEMNNLKILWKEKYKTWNVIKQCMMHDKNVCS